MFGDLDWPINESRGLSAIAEFLILPRALGVSAVFAVGRCLSVRLSVCHVRVLYPDVWRYRQTSSSAGSPIILLFLDPKRRYAIPKSTPGCKIHSSSSSSSSSSFGACRWRSRSSECAPGSSVLCLLEPWCKTEVERTQVYLHRSQPGMSRTT